MTDTLTSLYLACLDAYEDDTPRLVLADHLDELAHSSVSRVRCWHCGGTGWVEMSLAVKDGPGQGPEKLYVAEPPSSVRTGCPVCGGTVTEKGLGTVLDDSLSAQAELIRVQVELARWQSDAAWCPVCQFRIDVGGGCSRDNCSFRPNPGSDAHRGWLPRQKQYHALLGRESELLAHADRWRRPPCPGCGGRGETESDPGYHGCGGTITCPTCRGVGSTHPLAEYGKRPYPAKLIRDAGGVVVSWKYPARLVRGLWVVAVPLAELGREVDETQTCPRCAGKKGQVVGSLSMDPERVSVWRKCRNCDGKGAFRTGKRVWRPSPWALACVRHGVSFRVNDREPEQWTHEGRTTYSWFCLGLGLDRATIPESLFRESEYGAVSCDRQHGRMRYPTADAARDALGRAVLRLTMAAAKAGVAS